MPNECSEDLLTLWESISLTKTLCTIDTLVIIPVKTFSMASYVLVGFGEEDM